VCRRLHSWCRGTCGRRRRAGCGFNDGCGTNRGALCRRCDPRFGWSRLAWTCRRSKRRSGSHARHGGRQRSGRYRYITADKAGSVRLCRRRSGRGMKRSCSRGSERWTNWSEGGCRPLDLARCGLGRNSRCAMRNCFGRLRGSRRAGIDRWVGDWLGRRTGRRVSRLGGRRLRSLDRRNKRQAWRSIANRSGHRLGERWSSEPGNRALIGVDRTCSDGMAMGLGVSWRGRTRCGRCGRGLRGRRCNCVACGGTRCCGRRLSSPAGFFRRALAVSFRRNQTVAVRPCFVVRRVPRRSVRPHQTALQLDCNVLIHRAGVRFLLLHAQFRQHFDDHAGFHFKLPSQLVDSDLLHR